MEKHITAADDNFYVPDLLAMRGLRCKIFNIGSEEDHEETETKMNAWMKENEDKQIILIQTLETPVKYEREDSSERYDTTVVKHRLIFYYGKRGL